MDREDEPYAPPQARTVRRHAADSTLLPIAGRGTVVVLTFCVVMVVSVLGIAADLMVLSVARDVQAGADSTGAEAESIEFQQVEPIDIIDGIANLTCAVVFLIWFHRAYRNLRAGRVLGLRFSPGWAVGAFFIPILNLFRPCQVMSEVWRGSVILARKTDHNSVRRVELSPMVGLWWGLFLLANLSGGIAGVVYEGADTAEALATASVVEILAYFVTIVAALVAAWLVRRVTALQVEALSEKEELMAA